MSDSLRINIVSFLKNTSRPVTTFCGKNTMPYRKPFHIVSIVTVIISVSVLLGACLENKKTTNLKDEINTSNFIARFDPSSSIIPFPNNLLFSGTTDGTLNIPFDPSAPDAAVKIALNALDGFSTIAPITATFSSSIDSDTLTAGTTVRLFEVALSGLGGAVTSIVGELSASKYAVSLSSLDTSQSTIVISPLTPLDAKTSYLVVLTSGIKDTGGLSAGAELPYAMAKSTEALVDGNSASQFSALTDAQALGLEPVRQLTNAAEIVAAAFDGNLNRSDIVLSWTFTTQSISDVLSIVRAAIQVAAPPATTLIDSTSDSPLGTADIYVGTIALPYYLSAASNVNDDNPLKTFWTGAGESHLTQFNSTPVLTSTEVVPLIVSIPKNSAKPAGGWPVVIYQHGITTNRATLLAIADALANVGFAAVGIDLPLHGLTGNETDGTQGFYVSGAERTFDLDLINNDTGAPGSDSITDTSGAHFINLTSLLTSRDNARQAVVDLMSLTRALSIMDYDGGGADFDVSKVRFVGHSLGGIVGAVFLALEPTVGAATLAMTGAGVMKLLDGSVSYGPRIAAGLAASGANKGTASYEAFMSSAQMVLDASDPINFLSDIGVNRGILLVEIIGGNSSLSDQVIPNNVLSISGTVPSPTAGTDPMATLMGLSKISGNVTGANLHAWVRLTAGHHGSLLSPQNSTGDDDVTSASVLTEIQTQMASFLGSNGTTLTISNGDIVE